jgi:hypothetical protein
MAVFPGKREPSGWLKGLCCAVYYRLRAMNYDLAKALSGAGFPQGGSGSWILPPDKIVSRREDRVYVPTLSELIEAIGNFRKPFTLRTNFAGPSIDELYAAKGWQAAVDAHKLNYLQTPGDTAEEAVARLWLALNTKV